MPRPYTHLAARRSCPRPAVPALARGQVRAIFMDEPVAAQAGQPVGQGRMPWPVSEGKAAPLGDLGKVPRAVGGREMGSLKAKWLG